MSSRNAKRAVRALRERRWDDARSALDAALTEQPRDAELLFQRARALHGAGDAAAALDDLDRALASDAGHARALCLRATLAAELRPVPECLADLDRAIALEPGLANAYLVRAQLRARLGRRADAAADLDRAVELRPDSATARRARVRHLLEPADGATPEDARRALSDLDVMLETDQDAGLHYQRARALRALDRGEEAAAALTRVIDMTSPLDALQRAARAARRALWHSGAAPPRDLARADVNGPTPAAASPAAKADAPGDAQAAARLQRALPALFASAEGARRALGRRAVRRIAERLGEHGFRPRGQLLTLPDAAAAEQAAVALFVADDGRTSAWLREPLARRGGLGIRRRAEPDTAPQLELMTALDDGSFIVTSASDGPPPREIPNAHHCQYLVPGTDAGVLLHRHAEALDARLHGSTGVDVVLAYDMDTALNHYARRRAAVQRHLLAEGLIEESSLRDRHPAAAGPATPAGPDAPEPGGAPPLDAGIEDSFAALLTVMPADWQDGLRPGLGEAQIDALLAVLGEWRPAAALARLFAFRDGQEREQESFMPGFRLLPLAECVSGALDLAELSGPPLLPLLRGRSGTVFAVLSRAGEAPALFRQRAGATRMAPAYDSPAHLLATAYRCHAGGAYFREQDGWSESAEAAEAIRRRVNPESAQRRAAVEPWNPATWPDPWLARIGLQTADLKARGATVSTPDLRAWTFGQWPEPAVVRGRIESPARRGAGARFALNDGAGRIDVVCAPPWQLFVRPGALVEVRLRRPQAGRNENGEFEAGGVVPLKGEQRAR